MPDNLTEEPIKLHNQLNKDLVFTFIRRNGLVATDMKNKKSSWIKLKNDYFGNLSIPLSKDIFHNGYFVYNIQPEQLMEEIEQRVSGNDCNEKDRQILQKTLLSLEVDANNVVFIGKLKNEIKTKLF